MLLAWDKKTFSHGLQPFLKKLTSEHALFGLAVAVDMAYPFISSGIGALDIHGFMVKMAQAQQRPWEGLRRTC